MSLESNLELFFLSKAGQFDASGLVGKKVMIIWEGTAGGGRQYLYVSKYLQTLGVTVTTVGPPEMHSLAKHYELAYVCTSPSTHELLSRPRLIAACTANDYDQFEKAWALETEPYTSANIHVICQAIKGFEPDLILVSTRLLHRVLAIGNALAKPVLVLAQQEPSDVLGDCFEPAWATMKAAKVASVLATELQQWGSSFEQALGVSSPAAHFWPSVTQIKALAGTNPQFPYLTMKNFELLEKEHFVRYNHRPVGVAYQPRTLPWDVKKDVDTLACKKVPETNVFAVGCFQWDVEEEAYVPELVDRAEAQKLEEFIARAQENSHVADANFVYVCYGPVICKDLKFMTCLVLRALRMAQMWAIVDTRHGMSLDSIRGEPDEDALKEYCEKYVFFVQKVPTARFFSRCQICLNDGSSSMLWQGFNSRVISMITPIFGLQHQNAAILKKHQDKEDKEYMSNGRYNVVLAEMKGLVPSSLANGFQEVKNDVCSLSVLSGLVGARAHMVERRAQHRLPHLLRMVWQKNLKDDKFLKDMDDLKADEGAACRCCALSKRVQP